MSSDRTRELSFPRRLEAMLERHRRRNIDEELDDIAEKMEATLLQRALAEGFFEESVAIDTDAKERVRTAQRALETSEYETVETKLDTLREQVDRGRTKVGNEIQTLRVETLGTVNAMKRLNDRVGRVDADRLAALKQLLDGWEWRGQVSDANTASFTERRTEAERAGEQMRETFEELRAGLFGPYKGTDVWPIVESLLDEKALRYDDLTATERDQLADSDLSAYVELSLS
jgi:hypothetical protein